MSGSTSEHKPDGCLQKISHGIESGMTNFFSRLGELVASNPGRTVLLALVGKRGCSNSFGARRGGIERIPLRTEQNRLLRTVLCCRDARSQRSFFFNRRRAAPQ